MNLLVIPIKNKVSRTENGVSQNLLPCRDDETNVAVILVSQIEDEVAKGDAHNLTTETKVDSTVALAVRALGHVETLAVVLGVELLEDGKGSGIVHAGECGSRVEQNVGVVFVEIELFRISSESDTYASECHGETVLALVAANDGDGLEIANVLVAIQTTVDDGASVGVRVSQIEREDTAVDQALIGHGAKDHAVWFVAVETSSQIGAETHDTLRDTITLHDNTKGLVLELGIAKEEVVGVVADGGGGMGGRIGSVAVVDGFRTKWANGGSI